MKWWERFIIYPLCGLALLLSICTVSWNISADKSGFVVGVFTILVTILVGWQLYSVIGMHEAVRKFDSLQKDFDNSNRLLKLQDQRNITLINAFAKYYVAEKEKVSIATRYRAFVESLLLFIQSNIPIGNEHVSIARCKIFEALELLEENANTFDKQHLVDINSTMEETYDMLVGAINDRQEELSQFLKEVKSLRDRRRDLVKRFEKEKQQIQNPQQ